MGSKEREMVHIELSHFTYFLRSFPKYQLSGLYNFKHSMPVSIEGIIGIRSCH